MASAVLLEEVMDHLHNWFERESEEYQVMECAIEDGSLPPHLAEMIHYGQWYRVQGSWLNDGLHCHPADDLNDETFDGTVTLMRIPRPLLAIVDDIDGWLSKNSEALDSPYASESFGGYSYSLKSGISAKNGSQGLSGWRAVFRDRLNPWRKI